MYRKMQKLALVLSIFVSLHYETASFSRPNTLIYKAVLHFTEPINEKTL